MARKRKFWRPHQPLPSLAFVATAIAVFSTVIVAWFLQSRAAATGAQLPHLE